MRVVDVKLYRSEEVLYSVILYVGPVDHVLVLATDDDLSGDGDLVKMFIPQRRLLLVAIVEIDRHCCLSHAGLAILVNQFL